MTPEKIEIEINKLLEDLTKIRSSIMDFRKALIEDSRKS